jgi:hypothetical protein
MMIDMRQKNHQTTMKKGAECTIYCGLDPNAEKRFFIFKGSYVARSN